MHLLFIALTCLGRGQTPGITKQTFLAIWIFLKLVKCNEIHMHFSPKKVLEESKVSCRQSCAFILFVACPSHESLPLIGFDGTVSTEW